jgi:hypothetical protein
MYVYKISQDVNDDYDTYDSAVVVAESEDAARRMHPSQDDWCSWEWCDVTEVKVELIGAANENQKPGVICASYNAG